MHIVIGAGPAGLFCAHTIKEHGDIPILLEKENHVGGLAATHFLNGCNFEIGPHILYTEDQEILEIAKSYLGSDLIHHGWSVKQHVGGYVLKFPNSLGDMIKKLGAKKMFSFFVSYLKCRNFDASTYSNFIFSRVGKKLAEFSVINYTEKMWGVSMDELETEWIKPRLDRFTIKQIFRNTIDPKDRTYYYPRHGSGELYDRMAPSFNIKKKEYPLKISHKDGKVIKVKTNKSEYNIDILFSSLPLEVLIDLLVPAPPLEIVEAAKSLRYRSQVYVIIQFDENQILDCQWIYFNDTSIPFARIHEPKNFSDINQSVGKTLLVAEYFCFVNDHIWNRSDKEMVDLTLKHLEEIGIVTQSDSAGSHVKRNERSYPLMVTDRRKHLDIIQNYLQKLTNLYSIGRHGLHTFDNQDSAGRSAIDAVKRAYS